MVLQITPQVFKWLQEYQIVHEAKRNSNNNFILKDQIADRLFDGVLMSTLIKKLLHQRKQENAILKLDAIKQNSTPAIRLYNWNLLTQALKNLQCVLSFTQKSKILSLDGGSLNKLLEQLLPKGQPKVHPRLQVSVKDISGKQLKDSISVFQFLLISLCSNFKLSVQHALNLFLDDSKYLAHLMVKGLKGGFEPVLQFLSDISLHTDFIVDVLHCLDEEESLLFLLSALKPCLISKNQQVSGQCIVVLRGIHDTVIARNALHNTFLQWMKKQGMNTFFFALKRHPMLFPNVIDFCYHTTHWYFFQLLNPQQKSLLWNNQKEAVNFFRSILDTNFQPMLSQWTASDNFGRWMKFLLLNTRKNTQKTEGYALITCLQQLWRFKPSLFEQDEYNLPSAFLALLKTSINSSNELLFIKSVRILFALIQFLGRQKNNYAPLCYKIAVNCLAVEQQNERIQFICDNFDQTIRSIPSLPATNIWQAILSSVQIKCTASAFKIIATVIELNKLTLKQRYQAIQILLAVAFTETVHGIVAVQILKRILEDFEKQDGIFVEVGQTILAQMSSIFKKMNEERNRKSTTNNLSSLLLQLNNLMNLIKSILQYKPMQNLLESSIFKTYLRIIETIGEGKQSKLFFPLLYLYCAESQLPEFLRYHYAGPQVEQVPEMQIQQIKTESFSETQYHIQDSLDKKSIPLPFPTLQQNKNQKDIMKIKLRLERVRLQKQHKQKEKQSLQKRQLKIINESGQKMLLKFGSNKSLDLQYQCIKKWQSQQQQGKYLQLFKFEDEQQGFTDEAISIMKRYRKLWKFLFFKYSQKGSNSDQQKIILADILKLLKQYKLLGFIKKEESHCIVKKINEKQKRKHDLLQLTYTGFEQYILQLAFHLFNKLGHQQLSIGQRLIKMIDLMKQVQINLGGTTELFDKPQEAYSDESQVFQEFNRRLSTNPNYILPDGFKAIPIMQVKEQFSFTLVTISSTKLLTTYTDVLQILNDILFKQFQFKLIQPQIKRQHKLIAKRSLLQHITQKLKNYSKGYLLPKRSQQIRFNKISPNKMDYHNFPRFSLGIKLGLTAIKPSLKIIGLEVAYWLDDVLDSVENGLLSVNNKSKVQVQNQAIKIRRASMVKFNLDKSDWENKYKKRAETVKNQAQKIRMIFQQNQAKKRQKRREEQHQKKQKQEKEMRQKLIQFEKAKKHMQEKRQEQRRKLQNQDKARRQAKQQYKKGVDQYFDKKKKQLQEKAKELKGNKQYTIKQNQEKQIKKNQQKQKIQKIVFKNQQNVLKKIFQRKQLYQNLMNNTEIQRQFQKNRVNLKKLYDLLLKYEKGRISATDSQQLSLNTLNFFALRFNIVPELIDRNQIPKMLKNLLRDDKNGKSQNGFSYTIFEQFLLRITIKSKLILNDQNKKAPTQKKQQKKSTDLIDDYLSDCSDVTYLTLRKFISFLKIPDEKYGVQQRFKQILESRN